MHRRTALAALAAALATLGTTKAQGDPIGVGDDVPVVPIPPADGAGMDAGPIKCSRGVCVPGNVRFDFNHGQLFAQARDCCWYELLLDVEPGTTAFD